MRKIIVAGIGTGVGKTVVSAILTALWKGKYWKPVQCGTPDSDRVAHLVGRDQVIPSTYTFDHPASPHYAAHLENRRIEIDAIVPPNTSSPLVIEGVGGILVPFTEHTLSIDLFKRWECSWIVVSKHYLGSINHTLLTLEVLRQYKIPVKGLIFNGEPNPSTEQVILQRVKLPLLARLLPEPEINLNTIQKYTQQWKYLSPIR